MVHAKKLKMKNLPKFYYLITLKDYSKRKNTWKSALAVKHFWKLINHFYKYNLDKSTAKFFFIDFASLIAKLIVRFFKAVKYKWGQPLINNINKSLKSANKIKTWVAVFILFFSLEQMLIFFSFSHWVIRFFIDKHIINILVFFFSLFLS